jgi:MFS family permease
MIPRKIKDFQKTDPARVAVVAALMSMVAINQIGTGILFALIPVKLAADGHPATAAGFISTAFSIGFMIGCLIAPRVLVMLGAGRAPVALALFNATLAILHWMFPGPLTWALLRGVAGLSTASYFVLVESWLAEQSTQDNRGVVFGVYMVMNRAAFAFGQILLAFADTANLTWLFLCAATAYLVAPIARPRGALGPPPMTPPTLRGYFELPLHAPAAAAGALMHGLVFTAGPGLLPKWGVDVGVSVGVIATALFALQMGGLLLQLPVSFVSDKLDRRVTMAFAAIMTAAMSLLIATLAPGQGVLWFVALLVWGGFSSSLYSLSAAHANDLAGPERRVAWVSSLMLIWGTGSALGPLVASLLMDWRGSQMLWTYAMVVSLAGAVFLMWRTIVRPSRR